MTKAMTAITEPTLISMIVSDWPVFSSFFPVTPTTSLDVVVADGIIDSCSSYSSFISFRIMSEL